jgi:hypothetical protein
MQCARRFGLVYPGVGWLVFRDRACLPEDMVLMTSYLGRPEPTITMNFSRNAAQVAASYYNVRRRPPRLPLCSAPPAHAALGPWQRCLLLPSLCLIKSTACACSHQAAVGWREVGISTAYCCLHQSFSGLA